MQQCSHISLLVACALAICVSSESDFVETRDVSWGNRSIVIPFSNTSIVNQTETENLQSNAKETTTFAAVIELSSAHIVSTDPLALVQTTTPSVIASTPSDIAAVSEAVEGAVISYCNGTVAQWQDNDAHGTTCFEMMNLTQLCTVECRHGRHAVGSFFCSPRGFVGTPTCESRSTRTRTVNRFVGMFEIVVQLRRVAGLGLAFRESVLKALSESLVIPATDVVRLEVAMKGVLEDPQTQDGSNLRGSTASIIHVDFELALEKKYWVEQVHFDLNNLHQAESVAHQEIVSQLEVEGYYVIAINNLEPVISFADTAPVVTSLPTEDRGPVSQEIAIVVGVFTLFLMVAVCLFGSVWRRRKLSATNCLTTNAEKRQVHRQNSPTIGKLDPPDPLALVEL